MKPNAAPLGAFRLINLWRSHPKEFFNHQPHEAQYRIQLPEAVQAGWHHKRHLGRKLVIRFPESHFDAQPRINRRAKAPSPRSRGSAAQTAAGL